MIPTIHQTRPNGKKADHGFTLIEVLMAVSIFSIGILGVAAMQMASVKGNASARGVTDIATWASDRVEKLMVLPYSDNGLLPGVYSIAAGNLTMTTDGIDNDFDGLIDEGGETGPATIDWTIVQDSPVDNTKTLTVTVQHNGPSVNKSISITRVIPNTV
jgi:type IV pilus assembly protein PilV